MPFASTSDFHYVDVLLALVFSSIGSYLSVEFLSRMHRVHSAAKLNWLFISAIIHGASVWAANVLAIRGVAASAGGVMDPSPTFAALLVMLGFTTVGFAVALKRGPVPFPEAGGVVIGLGIIVAHFVLASAAGAVIDIRHDLTTNGLPLAGCVILSAAGLSIAARQRGQLIPLIASGFLVASICVGVFGIRTSSLDGSLATHGIDTVYPTVLIIMSAILGTALAVYNIENQSRRDAMVGIKNQQMTDHLTGLPNREALKAHVAGLVAKTDPATGRFVVVAITLNRFRAVNDIHGSEAGDYLLRTMSQRLAACLGPGEFVSRVSGDEFHAVKASGVHRKSDATTFAAKLMDVIHEPTLWREQKLDVSASIGCSLFPHDSDNGNELIAQADMAMRRAKAQMHGEPAFFDLNVDQTIKEQSALAFDLRMAVVEKEFEVYYQPQHAGADRRLIGFEALVRWNHPMRGLVSPAEFIPLAEKTGMINQIGAWVLREACNEAAGWSSELKIAVNVSAVQITRNDLPDIVQDALARSGLAPNRLELEITESGIIGDYRHALAIVNRIKQHGCSIAMDDFGTGYSSLSTFKRFPFDKIKIDRAFISDLETNKQSQAIVNAAIALGKTLDIKVLAEGVEDELQLAILNEAGCNEVQGYFFGKPTPSREVQLMLRENKMLATAEDLGGNVVRLKAIG